MIYLDNAATTRPDEECVAKAEKYLFEEFYNPSALYAEGYNIQREIKSAAKNIINNIADCNKFELIFTSGGTEADNQAIFCGAKRGNVVTTAGEHSAIFSAVNELKQRGIEVRFANLNGNGSVNPEHLLSLIDEKTSLVSVIHVNNETGAVNDILSLARAAKTKNKSLLFHSDGVQAFGKLPFRLYDGIDMYSVSAHKIGALKGCGALIKRKNLYLKPYIYGGGQQGGLRSGTENVFGIKAFEYAVQKKYTDLISDLEKIKNLNDLLRKNLDNKLFSVISDETCSPYILNVIAVGLRGETLMHRVNDRGLIVGTGSACASNEKKRYSRTIVACGIENELADGVLRISFSNKNTENEILTAAEILNDEAEKQKQIMA